MHHISGSIEYPLDDETRRNFKTKNGKVRYHKLILEDYKAMTLLWVCRSSRLINGLYMTLSETFP